MKGEMREKKVEGLRPQNTDAASPRPAGLKERPILFSAPMVRAILEGRKTVTRRIVNWERLHKQAGLPYPTRCRLAWFKVLNGWGLSAGDGVMREVLCPYGQPGDRLWVRETWMENHSGECVNGHGQPLYRASWGNVPDGQRWKPSIHMPRWASRINLEITDVKVERLQDISEEQAIAEGIEANDDDGVTYYGPLNKGHADPRAAFQWLWESINGAGSWDANPWVWAVSFQRVPEARSAATAGSRPKEFSQVTRN